MRMKGLPDMAYQAFDLRGKTAIVTGGNSGIGLGMAEALAQAGAAVGIWGTNEEKNHTALARLHAIGGTAMAPRRDLSDEAAGDRAFAQTVPNPRGAGAPAATSAGSRSTSPATPATTTPATPSSSTAATPSSNPNPKINGE